MQINIRLGKNFTTQYNKLQGQFGTQIARINGFDDDQLSYTDFIDNFIDEKTIANVSIDGNSNVGRKDIVTLLSEKEMYELIEEFKNSPDKIKYEYSFGYKNGEFR